MEHGTQPLSPMIRRVRTLVEALALAPAHIAVLLVLASCASAGLGALWWLGQHSAVTVPIVASPVPTGSATSTVGELPTSAAGPSDPVEDASAGTIVVHVSGAVASAGVVELAAGSRVIDAVGAAGGARRRARTAQLNLARVLLDGEQIHVPGAGDGAGARIAADAGGATAGAVQGGNAHGSIVAGAAPVQPPANAQIVDLNRATAVELTALPGVGPVLAGRIVAHRDTIGRYAAVEQLLEIDGIGEKTFAELRDLVAV